MKNTARPPDADLALPMVKVAIERYERRTALGRKVIRGFNVIAITGAYFLGFGGLAVAGVGCGALALSEAHDWWRKRASKETP